MKRFIAIVLAMATMLTLCLPVGATQAEPAVEVYETETMIVTIREAPYRPVNRLAPHTFIDQRICRKDKYQFDASCNPRNGDYLTVYIDNVGDPDIKIDIYVDNGDDLLYENSRTISSSSSGFFVEVRSKTSDGLKCDFGVTVNPVPKNTEMEFDIRIVQDFE